MKPISVLKSSIFCTFFAFFLAGNTTGLIAQEWSSDDVADFVIYVERTETQIVMECARGCLWSRVSFPAYKYKPIAINQWGMKEWDDDAEEQGFTVEKPEGKIEADKILIEKIEEVEEFLFKLTPKPMGISLEGEKGTQWTGTEFSLGLHDRWKIDNRGVGLQ
ncbi:MAG: hypothetical protein EA411_03150 [Saprospirales bacterium]|nr:MAG: hypothetical protein EA411_03150 [Saprospirales bacterium]